MPGKGMIATGSVEEIKFDAKDNIAGINVKIAAIDKFINDEVKNGNGAIGLTAFANISNNRNELVRQKIKKIKELKNQRITQGHGK